MYKSLTVTSIAVLFCFENVCARGYNIKNIGRAVSEAHVINKEKDTQAMLFGKNKTSNGLKALRANDLAKAIKNARKEIQKENNEEQILNNTEVFVVARVADGIITNIDILNTIRFVFFSSRRPFEKKYAKMMVKPVLESLVEDRIRQSIARSQNMDVNTEAQKKIEEIAKNNKLTIKELEDTFKKIGINITIFKNNIASKFVFNAFYQSVRQSITVDPNVVKSEMDKYKENLKHERYKFSEIFFTVKNLTEKQSVKEKADAIVDLLDQGFDFSALVDSVSQANTISRTSENEWVISENIDSDTRVAIRDLKPGQHSKAIEVSGGYKIIKLIDKAMPNKEGLNKAKIRAIVAEVPTPTPKTEDEAISLQMSINTIVEANSVEQFKRTCEVYGFKHMETLITDPNPIQMELINRNKSTGQSGIIRLAEDQPLIALFVISEEVPDAVVPDYKTISDIILNRKTAQEFAKIMKRQRIVNYETVYKDKLNKIID